jgi:hypothetical protein
MRFLALVSLVPYFLAASAVLIDNGAFLKTDTFDFIVVGGASPNCMPTLVG